MSFKRIYVFILVAFLVTAFGNAQISETSIIKGKVIDDKGQPLPEVTVTAKSPALILHQLDRRTDEKGFFRFSALSLGSYTLTFELTGFNTLIREGIIVTLGATATINVVLDVSTLAETVLVTGESPIIDIQKSTATTTFDYEFIRSIPTDRGGLDATFEMAPGATNRSYSGGTGRDNAVLLDGMSAAHPRSGWIGSSYGIDLIEELSIKTGALPAEHGDARGAVINAVSKSGGDEFSGMVNYYYRNLSLQSDNTTGTPFEGQKAGFNFEHDFSLNLGGPIIKEKLWFFTSLNLLKREDYLFGYPWDKQPVNTPQDTLKYFPFVKLSFQANASNKLVFSVSHENIIRHNRSASRFYTEEVTVDQDCPTFIVNLLWTSTFGNNFFLNTKVGGMIQQSNYMMKNNVVQRYDLDTRYVTGSYGYDNQYKQPTFQLGTDATYFVDNWMGSHEFKGGVQFLYGWIRIAKTYGKDPVSGLAYRIYERQGVPQYIQHIEDYEEQEEIRRVGAYIQDSWSPTERLSINIGFRFDRQEGIVPEQGLDRDPIVYQGVTYEPKVTESFKPLVWNTFSPRLALIYALTSDTKTALKLSFSRYYATIISDWFNQSNPNTRTQWRQDLNPDGTLLGDPYNFSSSASTLTDSDVKAPYVDEFILGIEREIANNLKLSVRYIRKRDKAWIEDIDLNSLDQEALKTGELSWTNYQSSTVVDPYDGQTVTFWDKIDRTIPSAWLVTSPPQARRNYDSLEVVFTKRYSHGWQMNASYVWAKSKGLFGTDFGSSGAATGLFDNPNAHTNAYGVDANIAPHQFKLQALFRGPWGINMSSYFFYFSGRAYTRTIRSSDLGLSLNQGTVTIFAEEKGSRRLPALSILDLRLEKVINLAGKFALSFMVDVFNVFNSNTTTGVETRSSLPLFITFEQTTGIYKPRMARIGFRFQF